MALSAAEYGLVKAAMSFEEERGFCFSTYAVRVMENEIRMELRKRNRRKKVVYFGDPVSGAEGLTLGDTIADTRDHFGMSETVHDLIRNRDLTEKEREAVLLRFQHPEKTQEECGQMIGIGQSAFSKYLNSARRKLKGFKPEQTKGASLRPSCTFFCCQEFFTYHDLVCEFIHPSIRSNKVTFITNFISP